MTTFRQHDRAYAMDANGTPDLRMGQLYHVEWADRKSDGTEFVYLTGHGHNCYLARRFVRVADPGVTKRERK